MQTLPDWLQNLDHEHTVILTPHHYLAEHLQAIANEQNAKSTWQLPTIVSFGAWLKQLWQSFILEFAQPLPTLILNSHSLFIWHNIIQQQLIGQEMLSVGDLAQLAQTARSLLSYWEVDYHPRLTELNLDQQRFYGWLKEYRARLNGLNWIDEADLLPFLLQYPDVLKKIISKKVQIIFYAFPENEHSPVLKRLISFLGKICQVSTPGALPLVKEFTESPRLFAATNPEHEIEAMVRWAYQSYLNNSGTHIACIVPKLSQQLPMLERIFKDVFQLDSLSGEAIPYNFSIKRSLLNAPMINMAFKFFSLLLYPRYTKEEVCYLLRSCFIYGAETEFSRRASLEANIQQSIKKDWSWNELYELAVQFECHEWLKILLTLQQAIDMVRKQKRTIRHWAEFISRLLEQIGWPGERPVCLLETNVLNSWLALLDQWVEMDFLADGFKDKKTDCGLFSYQEALDSLLKLARQKTICNNVNTRIHVMSLGDAWGMSFDYVWVMGMDESALPLPAQPHPFLLLSTQLNYGMPRSSAEKEMEYASEYWQQLHLINSELITSYAKLQDDIHVTPCRFVQHLPHYASPYQHSGNSYEKLALEKIQDPGLMALSDMETVKGGSAILKSQAECPFKAFASYRLRALPVELDISEIDSRRRGIFIHRALEILWEELQYLSKLMILTSEQLEIVGDKVVAKALQIKEARDLPLALLVCEKNRIKKLLMEWIEVEKTRVPFQVIAAESYHEIELAGLSFKLRIDRIDQLENGQKILVDYKTGQPSVNDWFGERPTEPQLPLYTIASNDQDVIGIAFAQVKAGHCTYRGVAPEKTIPGCYPLERYTKEDYSWEDQKKIWQDELYRLAQDFRQGKTEVDPKEGEKTCQTCQLQSLCRVKEGMIR